MASLKTSIQISLFLNNYYNQVFLLKCYLVLSTRTRTQGVFSKLVLNLVDTFTAPPLAIRTGLRVFIAEAPAPHHQPGGDEHHDGLPAPGRFHGHHHLPHVPRHREDLQWVNCLIFKIHITQNRIWMSSCLFQFSSPSTAPWSTTMKPCDRNPGGIQQQMHPIYAIYLHVTCSL